MSAQQTPAGIVSLKDLGFERGLAAFITFRCRVSRDGAVAVGLHYQDHYNRLMESCRVVGIDASLFTTQYLWNKVQEEIACRCIQNDDIVVKIFITPGESSDHMTCVSGNSKFFIALYPLFPQYPLSGGALRIKLVDGVYDLHTAKYTGKYSWSAIQRNQAKREQFDDILLANNKYGLTETSLGNIFFVIEQENLITPKRALHGVTRSIVLQLAAELGYRIKEFPRFEEGLLYACKEAFLTSTTKGVVPIGTIHTHQAFTFANCGKETMRLQAAYNQYVERYFKVRGA